MTRTLLLNFKNLRLVLLVRKNEMTLPFPEPGLLAHMDQMRMDPKHQFAAQYVLSRAANERREREALLAAAAMNMSHLVKTTVLSSSLTLRPDK